MTVCGVDWEVTVINVLKSSTTKDIEGIEKSSRNYNPRES